MKKFIIKLSFFFLVILALQISLSFHYFPLEAPDRITKLEEYLNNKIDVIYFGDSTIGWTSKSDKNKESISEILDGMLPDISVGSIDHEAYHMDIYYHLIKFLSNRHYHPKIVIMPINLSSFSPALDMRPGFQFEIEKIFLKYYDNFAFRLFYKPLLVFKTFNINPISNEVFMDTPVYNGEKKVGRVKDFENPNMSQTKKIENTIIYYYMYSLKRDHRKVKSLIDITRLLKQRDIKIIFYYTPINYQICEQYLSNEFRLRLINNIETINSLLREYSIDVLDLTFDLAPDSFCWIDDGALNEHLNEKGRKYVAHELYGKISEYHQISQNMMQN